MTALGKRIRPQEFAGQRAFVVGGSRGLGELTAKAIATGGGEVVLTFATGATDAKRVVAEIVGAGGTADTFAYDVTKPASEQLGARPGYAPTHLYYYATCQIFGARSRPFDHELLARFLTFYVRGFLDLCRALAARKGATPLTIFCPSTVAVEERPPGLTEYAMAKATSEVLCDDLPTIIPGTIGHSHRLPRLLTDQTAMVTPQELPEGIDVILPILRLIR
jgi:NAD(P)-dependent dehydrogenase (short-subunit alcohol dehydrogenase family)